MYQTRRRFPNYVISLIRTGNLRGTIILPLSHPFYRWGKGVSLPTVTELQSAEPGSHPGLPDSRDL